jgi:Cof subfamily protein (haloacid dehalogenase superfamily)
VAASGRQFQSIIDKLEPINTEISIIGENGGIMQYQNQTKVLLQLTQCDVISCIKLLRNVDNCNIVLCGRNAAYVETGDTKFLSLLRNYYSIISEVEDLAQVSNDQFLKIAVFHFESSEEFVFPFLNSLKDDYQVIVSGQHWLDISHIEANKAYALRILQEKLGISVQETLVFGDYNNDLEMLALSEFSFAMANSHPNVLKAAKYKTLSNDQLGVEVILEQLIASID